MSGQGLVALGSVVDGFVCHEKAEQDTCTRFETESDMMELCDLAEIL